MNMLQIMIFLAIAVNLCFSHHCKGHHHGRKPCHSENSSTATCSHPECKMTTDEFQKIFSSPKLLYELTYTPIDHPRECVYYTYSGLDKDGVFANYMTEYRTPEGEYIKDKAVAKLTPCGLTDTRLNEQKHATMIGDDVIVVHDCNNGNYQILCYLFICNDNMLASALAEAKSLAKKHNIPYIHAYNDTRCKNDPYYYN